MAKCNFTPCATCTQPCKKNRNPKIPKLNPIDAEKQLIEFKRYGCPYQSKNP